MKKIINVAMLALVLLSMSGCAVREADTPTQKALKHTVNAPMYAVFIPVAAAKAVVVGTIAVGVYGVNKAVGVLSPADINSSKKI